MAWWFAIPIVAAGAKLLYEVIQDDSSSSSSSTSNNQRQLSTAKSRRTKIRKKVVRSIIENNQHVLVEKLASDIEEYATITKKVNGEYVVSFEKTNEIISSLQNMMEPPATGSSNDDLYIIKFCDINVTTAEIVKTAKNDYGELSGINAQDEYVQEQDAFLDSFKSAAKNASSYLS